MSNDSKDYIMSKNFSIIASKFRQLKKKQTVNLSRKSLGQDNKRNSFLKWNIEKLLNTQTSKEMEIVRHEDVNVINEVIRKGTIRYRPINASASVHLGKARE